jgi:hypothetical protein
MFFGLPDPDLIVRGMDPDSVPVGMLKEKNMKKKIF